MEGDIHQKKADTVIFVSDKLKEQSIKRNRLPTDKQSNRRYNKCEDVCTKNIA